MQPEAELLNTNINLYKARHGPQRQTVYRYDFIAKIVCDRVV